MTVSLLAEVAFPGAPTRTIARLNQTMTMAPRGEPRYPCATPIAPLSVGGSVTEDADTRHLAMVDAFTDEPLAGTRAGVVPDAEGLTTAQLQAIARELGVVTVYLLPDSEADRRAQFFTPTGEIDRCGHALLAGHGALYAAGTIGAGSHTVATNAGIGEIELTDDTVWLARQEPEIREVDRDHATVAGALGIDEAALSGMAADLPLARARTDVPFLMTPVEYLSDLSELEPDGAALAALATALDCAGVYAFTFDTLSSEARVHGRILQPESGDRDYHPTASACGACGAYLDRYGAFDVTPAELVVEQGFFRDRGGQVLVQARDAATDGVRVGGETAIAFDGELTVPPREADDIVEA